MVLFLVSIESTTELSKELFKIWLLRPSESNDTLDATGIDKSSRRARWTDKKLNNAEVSSDLAVLRK